MGISKIILNGVTQMDVTQKTVTSANLLQGETALGADGEDVVGAMTTGGLPDKIAQSRGGDIPSGDFFPIHISWSNQEYTADKTFAEIQQAAQDGLALYMIYNGHIYFLLDNIIVTTQASFRSTPSFEYDGGTVDKIQIHQERFLITSENEITRIDHSYPQNN